MIGRIVKDAKEAWLEAKLKIDMDPLRRCDVRKIAKQVHCSRR